MKYDQFEKLSVEVPDGICGDYRVETFTVDAKESEETRLFSLFRGRDAYIPPGEYKRLMRKDTVVMSNTPMEVRTNSNFIQNAKGKVLINGLGLGMVLTAILNKPEVESVTVIEAAEEVINLVAPVYTCSPRINIIHANAFDYKPLKGQRFNAVWHDIWDFISADNLPEMRKLHRKYAQRSDWQGSWCRTQCERQFHQSNLR